MVKKTKVARAIDEAKSTKDDEWYTLEGSVSAECFYYHSTFKNASIFLPCDSEKSAFWNYFVKQFKHLGLKKLTATHYNKDGRSYILETTDGETVSKTEIDHSGDFRHPQMVCIMKDCDVVVTNPPFSLFRDFMHQVTDLNKKYLIIGPELSRTYKDIVPLFMGDKMWMGLTKPKKFLRPDGSEASLGNTCWFTNIPNKRRSEKLILWNEYYEGKYPIYQNYDAIEVVHPREFPANYDGVVGLSSTFWDFYNPEQFEVVGFRKGVDGKDLRFVTESGEIKEAFSRVLVRRR